MIIHKGLGRTRKKGANFKHFFLQKLIKPTKNLRNDLTAAMRKVKRRNQLRSRDVGERERA
jgi:hypothetical protein